MAIVRKVFIISTIIGVTFFSVVGGSYAQTLAPDGSWVGGDKATMAPDGSWLGNKK